MLAERSCSGIIYEYVTICAYANLFLHVSGIFTHCLISFLNLTIYQSSRWRRTRAWGDGFTTLYTKLHGGNTSRGTLPNHIPHFYSIFIRTFLLHPFRVCGKLYTNPHGGTYTMAPSEGVVRVRRHILITFHCAILQHYTPAALLLSPILFNIIHSCRHLVLAYRHLVFDFGVHQSPRRHIPLYYLTTTYALGVSTTFRDSFCRRIHQPHLVISTNIP